LGSSRLTQILQIMATLGALTLKLRSTRQLLALDLLQSKQEIERFRESANDLLTLKTGISIDWDSFSKAESEIRRWVDSLPNTNLQVKASFQGADLNEGIKELERLLNKPLKILVDDKRLFELNEHFKLKERDYKQLQNVLSSPLEIKVDRSQLDNLSRDLRAIENTPQVNLRANVDLDSLRTFHEQLNHYSQGRTLELATSVSRTTLNALQNDLKSLASNLTTARVSVQIDSQLQALRSELGNLPNTRVQIGVDVDDRRLRDLDASLDRLSKIRNLKLDLPDTLSGLTSSIAKLALSPISIPVKIAQNAISGVFEGFTKEIGAGISDGLGTRKFARNQSRRAGNYAQTLDKEIFGVEDYSAAFLSELIDSGDIKKSHKEAAPYLKANKHIDRVKRAIKLGELKKNPELMTEYPELMQVIPDEMMPAFNELGAKKFIRKHGLRPQADGTSLLDKISNRADLLGQELMPTEVVGAVVNPALATLSPALNFINKMQVARAVKHAKLAAPAIAATLPKLEDGQDGYLNVIGGGQFREGRGHQELTAAFEGVIPSRRLLGITNPETDPGGKLQKNTIGSLIQSALKVVVPDLANDPEQSNNIANVLTLLNRSVNPKFRSTATTQSIANVLAAKQTGIDPSKVGTLSYSFGGADARDTASGLNMLGLGQSKATALAYPDVNAYKPDLPNFQAMMLKQDVMGIPKTQFGLGSMANQRVYGVDKLAFGGAAHAYKHYFKSPELVGDINSQLGLPAVGGDLSAALHHGSTLSQTLHADRQINSILDQKGYDKTAPYVRDGDITLSELYSRFMEGNKKQDVSKYGPDQRALAEKSQAKFAKTEARIKADFLEKGVDPTILDKPGELKANIVLRGQAVGFNKAIEVFQSGIPQGEKHGYFAGNLDRELVKSRIPDAHNAAAYFTKELDATAPSTALVIDGFKKLAAVMQEFANNGFLSKETKADLKKTDVEPNMYLDSLAFSKLDTSKLPTHEQLRTTDRNQTTLVNEELDYRSLAATYRGEQKAKKPTQPTTPTPIEVATYNPFAGTAEEIKRRRQERENQGLNSFINAANPWSNEHKTETFDPSKHTPLRLDSKPKQDVADRSLAQAIARFDGAVTRFDRAVNKPGAKHSKHDVVDGEYVEVGAAPVLNAGRGLLAEASKPIGAGYSVLKAVEKTVLDLAPGGHTAKGIIQRGVVPLALGGIAMQSPILGGAIHAAGNATHLLAQAPIDMMAGMAGDGIQGLLSGVRGLPGGAGLVADIAGKVQGLISGSGAMATGAVGSVALPWLSGRLGMGLAGKATNALLPHLNDEHPLLSAGTQRLALTAGAAVKKFIPQTTLEPHYEIPALPPSKLDTTKDGINYINQSLEKTKAQIELAIKNGEIALAKKYTQKLEKDIAESSRLIQSIASNPNTDTQSAQQLSSTTAGHLKQKSNFVGKAYQAIDLMENGATLSDVKQQPGWSQKLKNIVIKGIRQNMGNNDVGSGRIEANPIALPVVAFAKFAQSKLGQTRVPGLDFLDNPLKSFKETIGLSQRESAYSQGTILGGDGTTRYTPPPTRLQSLIANARDSVDRFVAPTKQYIQDYPTNAKANFQAIVNPVKQYIQDYPDNAKANYQSLVTATQDFRENPLQTIRAGMILGEAAIRRRFKPSQSTTPNTPDNEPPEQPTSLVERIKANASKIFTNTRDTYDNAVTTVKSGIDRLKGSGAPLNEDTNALEALANSAKNVVKGFVAFAGISFVGGIIAKIGAEAITAAANFQDLKLAVGASTSSNITADALISRSTKQANQLGYNYQNAIQSDSSFAAATKGTALELVSGNISTSLRQYNRVLGVSEERQKLSQLAVQQMAGKGSLAAEEVFGQLAEASPGAVNVLARSQGLTIGQLRARMQEGGLNSADTLSQFGMQLDAESTNSVDGASRSTSATIGKVQNGILSLQTSVGSQLLAPATA
jgi:tape measure domain-containing protein